MGPFFALLPLQWHVTWPSGWRDTLDVVLMMFLVYQAYVRFHGTQAARIGAGLAVLGLFYLLAQATGLFLTSWVLGGIWTVAFILVIVLFQAEIRQILEQVNPVIPSFDGFRRTNRTNNSTDFLVTIADTCGALAKKRWGALLVFERRDPVEPLLRSRGVEVDARVSPQLLESLFAPSTPLHDGALCLRAGRVCRASCVLPLSETLSLPYFYGTRHRAAVGITERSDALAVVVSEERGEISAVERGGMVNLPGLQELYAWLAPRLSGSPEQRKPVWSVRALVTHNWQAKLGAMALVAVLWQVLVGAQNTEVGFTIPVVYHNIPAQLDLDGQPTQEVYLRVRGSRELLSFLNPQRLHAEINLTDAREGMNRYPLSAQEVKVPLGLQVAWVDPPRVTVRLKKKPPPEKSIGARGSAQKSS